MPLSKICSGPCKRKLSAVAENFQRDARKGDGLRARCKACSKSVGSPKADLTEVSRSTLRNADGKVVAEWIKTQKSKDDERSALLEALKDLDKGWKKPGKITKPKGLMSSEILNTITIGDAHLGALSWAEETGQDFDLKIAESNLFTAIDHLIGLAPKAKQALLIEVGDFFHSDSSRNETTKGTRVDVDSRWAKVLRVGIRAMRRAIDRLLETHENVHVICSSGNHDAHTSIMLALALDQFYENEKRVSIDTSPGKFHYYRFGKVLLGITHGDTTKYKDLPGIMAVDRARDWGETEFRYFLGGHVHHDQLKEFPGCIVETFRTLAPSDAWHKGQGYRSGQDLKLDVYHKDYGRVNRHIVGIKQIWDK